MDKDYKAKLNRLKKEYLESERIHQEEKECFQRVITTFATVVAMHEDMVPELELLKKMVDTEQALPVDMIDVELGKLKGKILARDGDHAPGTADPTLVRELQDLVVESCRTLKTTMDVLLEDFYPLSEELTQKAASIDIRCSVDMEKEEFEGATTAFTDFIGSLRIKISEDFRYITHSFVTLLEQVKDLEKALSHDFGGEQNLKRIEYFEMKVNSEVGSIVNSFNIYRTIDEIKSTVIEKIDNIKRIVTEKKQEDTEKAEATQKNIQKLKSRIAEAEKGMLQLTQKAEQFQTAAEKDGLTGAYNRKAFDRRIIESLKRFHEEDIPVCTIIFDVDNFKEINDTLGHVAGDKVLQKVAECLVQSFRRDDFIARYGGDEFVVVIEQLTSEMARERIMTFRNNLKRIRFTSYTKGDIPITVSAGISLAQKNDTPERMIERADKVMYTQKQKKRSLAKGDDRAH